MPYHDPFRHEHLFDLGSPDPSMLPQLQPQPPQQPLSDYPCHSDPAFKLPLPSSIRRRRISVCGIERKNPPQAYDTPTGNVAAKWFNNSGAQRINTDIYMYQALKAAYAGYPDIEVIDTDPFNANILAYVQSTGDGEIVGLSRDMKLSDLTGDDGIEFSQEDRHREEASAEKSGTLGGAGATGPGLMATVSSQAPVSTSAKSRNSGMPDSMNVISYIPPFRRLDGGTGGFASDPLFDRFLVKWHNKEFEVYIVDVRDGVALYFQKRQYIVTSDPAAALLLLKQAGNWSNLLHGEIWVYDQYWQKDPGLFQSIQKSKWEDIILPEELKEDLLKTVVRFYDSRETYERLRVPWKRGLIFYGPPGNGKTVSIKATMKTLFDREESIPTLYVKSLKTFGGPEFAINQIFGKARQQAPCYLVFEDLDSLVTDEVRSFFLNAVDGLSENQGILMIGSTNHLERLDPGIAKRPSRFDRKYLFPDPAIAERKRYCQLWQKKLADNDDVKFPDKLVGPIAGLMDGFSFAYMQEAFVSTLLKIANDEEGSNKDDEHWDMVDNLEALKVGEQDKGKDDEDGLDKYVLWREIKIQVANLKKEVDRGDN